MPGLGVRGNHGRFLSRDRSDIMEAVFEEGGGGLPQGTTAAQRRSGGMNAVSVPRAASDWTHQVALGSSKWLPFP